MSPAKAGSPTLRCIKKSARPHYSRQAEYRLPIIHFAGRLRKYAVGRFRGRCSDPADRLSLPDPGFKNMFLFAALITDQFKQNPAGLKRHLG